MRPFRISEAEAASLFPRAEKIARKPRGTRKPRENLPENQVESQILGFLRARGWLVERQMSGTFQRLGGGGYITVSPKGRCDWVAVRAQFPSILHVVERMEIEIKAPGRKPSAEQLKYIRDRNACGYLAAWWDSLGSFVVWYNQRF